VSSALETAVPTRSDVWPSPWRWLAPGGVALLCVFWPLFVFTGSQADYVISLAGACITAAALARTRSSLLVGFVAGLIALVGPEVNGQLGNGHATLGSLRLVDAATAVGAASVMIVALRARRPAFAPRRLGALALLSLVAVAYATTRWAIVGHRVDAFLRTDLRLLALAALVWLIAAHCRRGGSRPILWSLVIAGSLAAAKAAAIHLSGVYAIGAFDRLQASDLYSAGRLRTILIGGDTLMILVPALAVLLASDTRRVTLRVALAICALACMSALGLSATRTSALVALGLIFVALAAMGVIARRHLSRWPIAACAVLIVLVVGVALVGGTGSRLTQADAPHVGLNFRKDEINSFLRTDAGTKYLGQGLGGRFMGKDVNGKPALTGWAHELPVWIALKTGILGLVCAGLALAVLTRRVVRGLREGIDRIQILAGAVVVLGVVAMSMTLDRAALVEGAVPLVIGVFLISPSSRTPIRSNV
jgi:hypothetical protein